MNDEDDDQTTIHPKDIILYGGNNPNRGLTKIPRTKNWKIRFRLTCGKIVFRSLGTDNLPEARRRRDEAYARLIQAGAATTTRAGRTAHHPVGETLDEAPRGVYYRRPWVVREPKTTKVLASFEEKEDACKFAIDNIRQP